MVFMPPGHGKSLYTSIYFPLFYLAQHPDDNVILISHNNALAEYFSRKSRAIAAGQKYRLTFDIFLNEKVNAAKRWETDESGEYYALGIGSAVTGKRADLVIIDDPISGIHSADSDKARNKLWHWYLSDLRTRLKPNGKMVIIQTRWHEDDLSGRILESNDKNSDENWEVIRLPALAEENDPLGRKFGEALWPKHYTKEILETEKNLQLPRVWNALYQQSPLSEEGDYFNAKQIQLYNPDKINLSDLTCYGASDYAVSKGAGDYTVHGVFGLSTSGDLYVLDWWREQASSDVWVEKCLDLIEKWDVKIWVEESGQIIKSLGPFINQRQRERGIYTRRKQLSSTKDKEIRARSIQARIYQGKVFFPTKRLWRQDLVTEMLKFPNGKYDDQVDVLSLMGRMLDKLVAAKKTPYRNAKSRKAKDIFDAHLKQKNMLE